MRRVLALIFLLLYIMNIEIAGALFSWDGQLDVGDKVRINDILLVIDKNKLDNTTALIVYGEDMEVLGLYKIVDSVAFNISDLSIRALVWKDRVMLSVQSGKPFSVIFNETQTAGVDAGEVKRLRTENENLRKQISELNEQLSNMKSELEKLKKENANLRSEADKLKTEINRLKTTNTTKCTNQTLIKEIERLKRENQALSITNQNLKEQIDEYRRFFAEITMMKSNISKEDYIYQAKKEWRKVTITFWALKLAFFGGGLVSLVLLKKYWDYRKH